MSLPLLPRLPGEGDVSGHIKSVQRSGRGVLLNAVHKDVSSTKPSLNIIKVLLLVLFSLIIIINQSVNQSINVSNT